MNKGAKTIGAILLILLLSVLIFAMLLSSVYPLPFKLEEFRFLSLTNFYVQQYVFWVTAAFAVLTLILILVLLFYPKTYRSFLLKKGDGELTLDKKAIEGMVRSRLTKEEFVSSPKVTIKATKNKIDVKVKGELKRTSSLIGKTGALMTDIERDVKQIIGTNEPVNVLINYTGFDSPQSKRVEHSRVQ